MRALAIVLVVLAAICGMIAWSQWYAIHVNVPMYQAKHATYYFSLTRCFEILLSEVTQEWRGAHR